MVFLFFGTPHQGDNDVSWGKKAYRRWLNLFSYQQRSSETPRKRLGVAGDTAGTVQTNQRRNFYNFLFSELSYPIESWNFEDRELFVNLRSNII